MKKTFDGARTPTCYFLIGLPGSGKSTWTRNYLETTNDAVYVASTDNILERMALEHGLTYAQSFTRFYKDAEAEYKIGLMAAARRGDDIIIDRTNLVQSSRDRTRRMLLSNTRYGYRFAGVTFVQPLDVIRERLIERQERTGKEVGWCVIETMLQTAQYPEAGEFDDLTGFSG